MGIWFDEKLDLMCIVLIYKDLLHFFYTNCLTLAHQVCFVAKDAGMVIVVSLSVFISR